jgi:hypothetical protein
MPDSFVPLVAAPVSNLAPALLPLKVLSQGQTEAKALFEPLAAAGRAEQPAKACGRPSVTLQRQGEFVSGIRIECSCGQVIELACGY